MKTVIYSLLTSLLFFISSSAQAEKPDKPEQITVKFQVKYDGVKQVKNPGIRGNLAPLSWEKSYPLTDDDGDGIYEATIRFDQETGAKLQYKFVHGKGKVNWELSNGNRSLNLFGEMLIVKPKTWNVAGIIDTNKLRPLTRKQLQQDFAIARKALETAHPGLYRYNTKAEIAAMFDRYEKSFAKPMTHGEAYLNFSKMLAEIRCSHTFANYYGQSPLIKQAVLNKADKLPFTFRLVDQRMIVTASGTPEIASGTEIHEINGHAVREILEAFKPILRMDGHNEAKAQAELNLTGLQDYETFDVYFPILFPPKEGKYNIQATDLKTGTALQTTVATLTRKDRRLKINARQKLIAANDDELWQYQAWEGGIGYLQLGTFDDHNFSFEWTDYLNDVFKKIRKSEVTDLIIDIRWNEGGQDEVVGYLAGFIADRQPELVSRHDQIAYQVIPEDLRDYMSTWNPRFYDMSAELKPEGDHYTWKKQDDDQLKLMPKRFEGNVYLLTNGTNSSASFFLAEAAKSNQMATLVGETTGGNQKGINGGMMFFVRLPNSKVHFDIPIIGMYSEDKPDAGISPDYEVKTTVEDLLADRDPVIEKVKALITKGKSEE
ncbi:MAG: S41 family peptidase [Roseivirga sp.]